MFGRNMAICSIKLMKTRLFNVFAKRSYNDIFVNRLQHYIKE